MSNEYPQSMPPPPPPPAPPTSTSSPSAGYWQASDGNWYPPQPAYGQLAKTNGLAIASLVLGILWLYWVGSVLALVFGYIAKRQIDESRGTQGGRGLAVAGIVLGYIGIAVIGIVVAAIVTISVLGESSTSEFERIGDRIGESPGDFDSGEFDPGEFVPGEPAELARLETECRVGDMASCDDLYLFAPIDSALEEFGATCGGRTDWIAGDCFDTFG